MQEVHTSNRKNDGLPIQERSNSDGYLPDPHSVEPQQPVSIPTSTKVSSTKFQENSEASQIPNDAFKLIEKARFELFLLFQIKIRKVI